jgi:hypothetical protein
MLRQRCTESVSYIQIIMRSRWQGEQHAANQYKIILDQQRGDFMKDRRKNKKRGNDKCNN